WNIRLTVTDDDGASNSKTVTITVGNRTPVANFTYSPTTVYNNTTVTFTDKSTDSDNDTLTYKWEYQEPNSTTWTQFSTEKNPTKVLNKKKAWNIRLTVTDDDGATNSK
uniref:PKD domain-containing protein n=1 Tax=Aeromonas sp. Ne-1 TaxID=1675689 RepID=UPI001562F1C4